MSEQAKTADELRAEIGQAHHILDLLNVPRAFDGSDGKPETYTLLGRMRLLEADVRRLREATSPCLPTNPEELQPQDL